MSTVDYRAVSFHEPTVERMQKMKPYDTISWDEWMNEVLDEYEQAGD